MVQTIDLDADDRLLRPTPDGRDARERLNEAGGRLFAECGYDDVSTRRLSKHAKVNRSAITCHFGGKHALHHAVFERIVEDLAPVRRRLIAKVRAGIAGACN